MHPSLLVIAGPLIKDASYALDSGELSIGRDLACDICLTGKWVSRRHCSLQKGNGSVTIRDLDSRNGTFVNGVPVKERLLQHGDVIAIGDSYFRFIVPGYQEPQSQAREAVVAFEDRPLSGCTTVSLQREDSKLLNPEKSSAVSSQDRLVRDLRTLVTVATRIGSIQDSDSLLWQILGMILEVVPAERGAILLRGDTAENLIPAAVWSKSDPAQPVQISRTVALRVLRDSSALMVNDTSADETLKDAESLVGQQVRSILSAPLTWTTTAKPLGVVYLDSGHPDTRFDGGHLELLLGIAGITAMALTGLRRAEWLRSEAQRLQAALDAEHNMVGESPALRQVLALIAKVAPSDSTVLLCGESGTGKELAAHAIHRASTRRNGPFIAINCAAIPEALLESELFGYDKGAFTGATVQKKGQVELANGGTLLLDEIGELAPALQAKLLRVLQEREFTRVGGGRPLKVDIRLIAATNRDLASAVKAGTFRQDLYYRLNVVSIVIPPLRDRREDISLLSSYFASKLGAKCKRRVLGISPEAQKCLLHYDWPGNIRELENAIERAVVLGSSEVVLLEDLPESLLETQPLPMEAVGTGFHSAITELKKKLIINAIKDAGGNYTDAAKKLGVNPTYLHRLIRNLNLRPVLPT
jgi:transcriptional regulator with GAF, ATPase, and Fis domain